MAAAGKSPSRSPKRRVGGAGADAAPSAAAPVAPAAPPVPVEPPLVVPTIVLDDTHEEVKRRAVAVAARIEHLVVNGQIVISGAEDLQYAADIYNSLGLLAEHADDLWNPLCVAFHRFHKELCSRRDAAKNLALVPRARISAAINDFNREQARLKREAEDRARLEREEAQRKVDVAHTEALEIERKRLEAERSQAAADAAAAGDKKLAKEILATPVPEPVLPPPPPAVVEAPAVPAPVKAAGISTRTTWKLARYAPEDGSGVKREYCIPDEKTIKRIVGSMGKRAEAVVGGIVVEEDFAIASTGRKPLPA